MAAPRRVARVARAGLVLAFVLALVPPVIPSGASVARAATPSPGIVPPGDTRSEGEGAGFVGSPVLIALGVVALGAGAAAVTMVYLRLRRD